ncbi:MAG: long-chain fatty acid--CoA ligase [Candidatus Marinimicrobia bacterium]|nr:long-chain fatty acid--CoA ligase [Candidatus Neomarinimicrobiota bacterium]MDD5062555.1 long-chain fatty acid--CoA ligase [Candidatus Neomarinimicrobiota bacterium]
MAEFNYSTISEMFVSITDKYSDRPMYGYKQNETWLELTFAEVRDRVEKITCGLKALELNAGDHVAIIAPNSHLWAMADYGTVCARGIVVTIYPTLTAKQVWWIAKHSEARFMFCGDSEQTEKVIPLLPELHHVEKVVVLDDSPIKHPQVISLSELMHLGSELLKQNPDAFLTEISKIKESDILTLNYTSGTTGDPKGVMLTHGNLTSNIAGSLKIVEANENDTFLSFLPLSHSFERMAGHYLATGTGAKICYAENINTVAGNMLEVRPTLMTAVPRFYEKVYAKVIDNISTSSKIRQKLFWWAIDVGKKVESRKNENQGTGGMLGTRLKVAQKLVFSKLQEKVGGRLRFFVSGGAPLSKEIAEFFKAAGISILEGYGLTETSPVISINPLDKCKVGTVGPKIPNVEVKIAPDGEIMTRGPHVMLGYFKDEAATREVLDPDGWFHTGDIGMIDDEGYITITDRKKNILVTSGGKNVAPQPMENVLVTSKWIEQIVVIGDKRKFVSALVVPAFMNLENWAKENNLQFSSREELIALPAVKELYDRVISESMEGFAQFEKVKKYILIPSEFTIERGELTPSLKVKRAVVENRYAQLIESMYQEVEE